MYDKFKYDNKLRFQLKLEDMMTEEYCVQTIVGGGYPNELGLENFFNIRPSHHTQEDKGFNENLFLKELRYYSLREQNDTLTLSTHLLENEDIFKFFIDTFSNNRAFMNYCK
jgi:hypothetical protein